MKEFSDAYTNAKDNSEKVDLIRTFAIPNTKEDILEFAILAVSNVDERNYSRHSMTSSGSVSENDLIEAWMSKLEQVQQKSRILLSDDGCSERINELYFEKKYALEKIKKRTVKKRVIALLSPWICIIACFAYLGITGLYYDLTSTEAQLERQVKKIEKYIAKENYESALITALAMPNSYSDSWSETRARLINKIQELQGKEIDANDHKGKIQFPYDVYKEKQVGDVVLALKYAGFTNIIQEPAVKEPLTGWLENLTTTKGTVLEISVNGSSDYQGGDWIDVDAAIIVRYWD